MEFNIQNESEDHKYFTIIPNYILNHSTAIAQALYLQLKRLAGENGKAYPASKYLRNQLGISQPTLRKELKYLLDKGWIKDDGKITVKTDGGPQKIQAYKMVDLWNLNAKYYKNKGCKNNRDLDIRGEKINTKGVKTRGERIGNKEEPLKEEPSFNKNITSEQSSQDQNNPINQVFEVFYKTVNPAINYGNKTNRTAADWMIKKWGLENVIRIAEYACSVQGQPYTPTITTPGQLKEKSSQLKIYKEKQENNNSLPKGVRIS